MNKLVKGDQSPKKSYTITDKRRWLRCLVGRENVIPLLTIEAFLSMASILYTGGIPLNTLFLIVINLLKKITDPKKRVVDMCPE